MAEAETQNQFERVGRYERFLRALVDDGARSPIYASLGHVDAVEWISEQARNLLDGSDAECPHCETPLHEGACVGADGEVAAPAKCRVCGCTDLDCRACIERTGQACHWVEAGLCSACEGVEASHV